MATGLLFPANLNGTNPGQNNTVRMRLIGANVMPLYPHTGIWKIMYFRGTGFQTTYFHSHDSSTATNDGSFFWNAGNPDTYVGPNIWPPGGSTSTVRRFEIAVEGGDAPGPTDDNGNDLTALLEYNRWYTQALVCENITTNKRHRFYWDLDTNTNRVIAWDAAASYGSTIAPYTPALNIGDAPWNNGNERLNGIIRGLQFYDSALTLANIQAELATPGSAAALWYLNLNPTVADITDKKVGGTPHPFVWVGNNRPQDWTDTPSLGTLGQFQELLHPKGWF